MHVSSGSAKVSNLCSETLGKPEAGPQLGDVWIVPDALDVPEKGAKASVEEVCPQSFVEVWCNPEKMVARRRIGLVPAASFLADKKEWMKVLLSFRSWDMATALLVVEMALAPGSSRPVAGAFSIQKESGRLRIIIDRQPWNFWEFDIKATEPATLCLFCPLPAVS